MLPKKNRVRKGDFKLIFKTGNWIRTSGFNIVYTKYKKNSYNQFTIVVGKKIGKAVERNRIKRIIREMFSEYKEKSPSPIQCIVMWQKTNPSEKDFLKLKLTLAKLLDQDSEKVVLT